MASLTRVPAAAYASMTTAEKLATGLLVVKESGRPDFAAMVERSRLSDAATRLMFACGFTHEQACRVIDSDAAKAHADALPF